MDRSPLDLYKPDFWYTLAIAVVVLVPLTAPVLRKWAWASINLAFLWVLLGTADLVTVCAGILAAYIVLRAVERRWLGVVPLALGGLAVLALFVVHKLPALATVPDLASLKAVLKAIGFSYVALRLVDALRLTREGRHVAPDLPSTINYLLPFHMLAAGPIQGYADFLTQPAVPPPLHASDALGAGERIALGLFKKYVVANIVDKVLLTDFRAPFPYIVLEAQLYYLWVYLDFSAYSDIAVGAGRLLGVATPENFNRPYAARNLVDFWDRWHISLSQFIRRNLFIPVQMALVRRTGGRAVVWCAAVAFSVSFSSCGLWHGLEARWALWGGLQALGLATATGYRAWLKRRLSRESLNRYLSHRGIQLGATILTQEFVACTLLAARWPWE